MDAGITAVFEILHVVHGLLVDFQQNGDDVEDFLRTISFLELIFKQASKDFTIDQDIIVGLYSKLREFLDEIQIIKNQSHIKKIFKVSFNRRRLERVQKQLDQTIMLLQTTFGARPDQTFDALHLIKDPTARQLWSSHFGKEAHQVEWDRFVYAIKTIMVQQPSKSDLSNLKLLLDPTGTGIISVYTYNAFIQKFVSLQQWPIYVSKIFAEVWFYGYLTEEDASAILVNSAGGTYMIHIEPGTDLTFICSYIDRNTTNVAHFQIYTEKMPDGSFKYRSVDGKFYDSVESLISCTRGPSIPLISPLREIWKHKAFFGVAYTSDVQQLLFSQPVGAYVLRLSTNNPKSIMLAARTADAAGFQQVKIGWTSDRFIVESNNKIYNFKNIHEVIFFYRKYCISPCWKKEKLGVEYNNPGSYAGLYVASQPKPVSYPYPNPPPPPKPKPNLRTMPQPNYKERGIQPEPQNNWGVQPPTWPQPGVNVCWQPLNNQPNYYNNSIPNNTYNNNIQWNTQPGKQQLLVREAIHTVFAGQPELQWSKFQNILQGFGVSYEDLEALKFLLMDDSFKVSQYQFMNILKWFSGSLDLNSSQLVANIFGYAASVARQRYFHGWIDSGQAKFNLQNEPPGAWLLRCSPDAPHFIVTTKDIGQEVEFNVFGKLSQNGMMSYTIDSKNWMDLNGLIALHQWQPIPNSRITLTKPIQRPFYL